MTYPHMKMCSNKYVGVTGILQAQDKIDWLDGCYTQLRTFDKEWSKVRGWNESIKLTTVKPSGTLSLLAGVTPGIHPALYKYYIRRIRMASNDPLIQTCKEKGYPVEYLRNFDGSLDYGTLVVSFPCVTAENTPTNKDLSAVEQLQFVSRLQSIWSDNAVSCTVYYRKEELPYIRTWLAEHYEDEVKSVSFLLANDHGFEQSPYEEITEDEYYALSNSVSPLTTVNAVGDFIDSDDCSTGACPIR